MSLTLGDSASFCELFDTLGNVTKVVLSLSQHALDGLICTVDALMGEVLDIIYCTYDQTSEIICWQSLNLYEAE